MILSVLLYLTEFLRYALGVESRGRLEVDRDGKSGKRPSGYGVAVHNDIYKLSQTISNLATGPIFTPPQCMSLAYQYPSVAILFSPGLFHPHCNRWRQYSYCLSGCGPTACACVCAASGGEPQNSETQHFCYDRVCH